jgi:hypothetical protein
VREFADATPLGRHLFSGSSPARRAGPRATSRSPANSSALDNVVANFTGGRRLLADNLVAILQTVKNLTQPQMPQAINNAVEVYQKIDFDTMENIALRAVREANKPEMRGLGLIVFLRNLSAHTPRRACRRLSLLRPIANPQLSTNNHAYSHHCQQALDFDAEVS